MCHLVMMSHTWFVALICSQTLLFNIYIYIYICTFNRLTAYWMLEDAEVELK
jgi:hypothetical protein